MIRRRIRPAFTLVELLVVVAIIIALLAMLLPSMGRAIAVAQRAQCASNMHQWHTAALSYAADNMSAYPDNSTGRDVSWVGKVVFDFWADYLVKMSSDAKASDVVPYCPTQAYHRAYATNNPNAVNDVGIGGTWLSGYFWLPSRTDNAMYDYKAFATPDPNGSDLVTYRRFGRAPAGAPILTDMKQYYVGTSGSWSGWHYAGVPMSSHARPDGEAEGGNFTFEDGHTSWYDSDRTANNDPADPDDLINVGAQLSGFRFYYRTD